jgi:hypothetical protein
MQSDVTLPWIPDVKKMLLSTKKLCTDKDLISAIASEINIVIDDLSLVLKVALMIMKKAL